jgi:hypothetical protein
MSSFQKPVGVGRCKRLILCVGYDRSGRSRTRCYWEKMGAQAWLGRGNGVPATCSTPRENKSCRPKEDDNKLTDE